MSLQFELALAAMALLASAVGSMLGMASGVFIVPLLALLGVGLEAAVGASIVSVIACSCGGAAPFLAARFTNVRLAILLETATTLGALAGVLLGGVISESALYLLFAGVLAVSVWQMLARRRQPTEAPAPASTALTPRWADRLRLHSAYPDPELGRDVAYRVGRLPLGMTLMFGAGLLSALLGIGSGVLKLPAMDGALRLPIKVSSATSNFMIGVTAAASAGAYFMRGQIVPGIAGPIALGSVAGSMIGGRVLMRVSSERLRGAFVAVLALLALHMFLSGLGLRPFGSSQ